MYKYIVHNKIPFDLIMKCLISLCFRWIKMQNCRLLIEPQILKRNYFHKLEHTGCPNYLLYPIIL